MFGPDPNALYPNEAIRSVRYIKNEITNPHIQVGEYTYYSGSEEDRFEQHVTHHYPFLGDRLIIGKFCALGEGITFIMNGANHRMASATTYPFNIFGHGWENCTPSLDELPLKGDTVVGNDVWIGQNVTILPGVQIGDGAIIGANAVVASDIPPYAIAVGNPCRMIRQRFPAEVTERLLALRWWDWDAEKISRNLQALCSGDLTQLMQLAEAPQQEGWKRV